MMGKNKESKPPEIARLLNVREENFFTKLETPKDMATAEAFQLI